MTSVVDTDGKAVTYTYSSDRLTKEETPDGGVATINYSTVQTQQGNFTMVSTINEPGGGTETIQYNQGSPNFKHLWDSESTFHTITYYLGT